MSASTQERPTEGMGPLPIVVQLQPVVNLSDEQLFDFCQVNRDLRIERNSQGELIIMPPAASDAGDRNAELTMQLRIWAKRDGTGKSFDSSAGFLLSNGAVRSPDASWLRLPRWEGLAAEQKKKFAPLCPDFVIELRSESDRLRSLQDKMQEYLDNGAELGLLIDPLLRRVHVYRRNREIEILDNPVTFACEPLLPGFTLDLQEIW
jgi:Uma2 family endonuclease